MDIHPSIYHVNYDTSFREEEHLQSKISFYHNYQPMITKLLHINRPEQPLDNLLHFQYLIITQTLSIILDP